MLPFRDSRNLLNRSVMIDSLLASVERDAIRVARTLISSGEIAPYRSVHTDIPTPPSFLQPSQNLRSFERN